MNVEIISASIIRLKTTTMFLESALSFQDEK